MNGNLVPTSPSAISRLLNRSPELNFTNAPLRVRRVDNSQNIAVQGENEQQVAVACIVLRHKGYVVRKTGRILYVYGKPAPYAPTYGSGNRKATPLPYAPTYGSGNRKATPRKG